MIIIITSHIESSVFVCSSQPTLRISFFHPFISCEFTGFIQVQYRIVEIQFTKIREGQLKTAHLFHTHNDQKHTLTVNTCRVNEDRGRFSSGNECMHLMNRYSIFTLVNAECCLAVGGHRKANIIDLESKM